MKKKKWTFILSKFPQGLGQLILTQFQVSTCTCAGTVGYFMFSKKVNEYA